MGYALGGTIAIAHSNCEVYCHGQFQRQQRRVSIRLARCHRCPRAPKSIYARDFMKVDHTLLPLGADALVMVELV